MSEELKPCPFCGSIALDAYTDDDEQNSVCCMGCWSSSGRRKTEEEAAAVWNTRALESDNTLLRDKLEVAREALGKALHELEAYHRCTVGDQARAEVGAVIVAGHDALAKIQGQQP